MNRTSIALSLLLLCAAPLALAETLALDQLLEKVKAGRVRDAEENAARLARFRADQSRQAALVEQAKAARGRRACSRELEAAFEANDQRIVELDRALKERLFARSCSASSSRPGRPQLENSLTHV